MGKEFAINAVIRLIDKLSAPAQRLTVQLQGQMSRTSAAINRMTSRMTAGLAGLQKHSGKIAAVGAGISYGLGRAALKAGEFEHGMAEVSTLIDTAHLDMGKLGRTVRDLSVQYGRPVAEITKTLYTTISSGTTNLADAMQVVNVAVKLAKGGATETSVAVDGLTSIINGYKVPAAGMTDVSDKLFVAMRAGKTTISELSESIGMLTALGPQTGVSLGELLAATSALTLGGQKTEVAMTGLRGILAAVMKQSPKAVKTAARLGIDFRIAAIQSMGFAKWLAKVGEKSKGSASNLMQLFGRIEGTSAALALTTTQAAAFNKILDQMKNSAGETDTAYAKMTGHLQDSIKKTKEAGADLSIIIGSQLAPAATAIEKATLGARAGLLRLTDKFPTATAVAINATAGFAGLAVTLGALGLALDKIGAIWKASPLFAGALGFAGKAGLVGLAGGGGYMLGSWLDETFIKPLLEGGAAENLARENQARARFAARPALPYGPAFAGGIPALPAAGANKPLAGEIVLRVESDKFDLRLEKLKSSMPTLPITVNTGRRRMLAGGGL